MKLNTCVLAAFLCVSLTEVVMGQEPRFHNHFDIYTTKNGLTQNDVRSIFQDSDGFIWIGTHGGLNRFDGYDFKTYKKEVNDKGSIPSNLIASITEDKNGNLWIGTDDEGIAVLKKGSESFISIKNDKKNPHRLTGNRVITMLVDNNNAVWIGTTEGLNKIVFDSKANTFDIEHFIAEKDNPNSLSDNHIGTLFEDEWGNLWIGTNKGLNRYLNRGDDSNHQFLSYQSDIFRYVRAITVNDSSLLIASSSRLLSLPIEHINRNNPEFRMLKKAAYYDMIIDKAGNIWGINDKGIDVNYMSDGKLATHRFKNNWTDLHSLSKDIVTSIMEDRSGILWVGTNGGGLNSYNPNRKDFLHFRRNNNQTSLSYNKIRAVKEDHKGNLWIGTEGGGLNLLPQGHNNDYGKGFEHFSVNKAVIGGGNYVYSLEIANINGKHKLFIGTGHGSNLEVMDLSDFDNLKKETLSVIRPEGPVFALHYDSEGTLWAGTYLKGLFRIRFDKKGNVANSTRFFKEKDKEKGISSNVIRSINEDKYGNIWIGTDEGVNKLTLQERKKDDPKFIKYIHDAEDPTSISYDYILPIFISSKGDVWIGTLGGGMNKVVPGKTPEDDRFDRVDAGDGLSDNVVKSIEEDEEGFLWISTNRGLSKFDPKTKKTTNYGISDGLQDEEFGELASTKKANGELVFGGVNGANVFLPKTIMTDTSKVSIVFTDLQVLNRDIHPGDTVNRRVLLTSNLNTISKLELLPTENSFSINFSGLHYSSPEKNKYAYKLDGFDEEWIYTKAQNRIAKYTNLSPGKYILMVKASNSDGIWNEEPIQLEIEIRNPLWLTKTALFIYAIIVLLGLWFFRKYTLITNSRKSQLVIEHLEREKTEELSQLKLKFFTNVSHEFRTPLTLISGLIDQLRNPQRDSTEAERHTYYDKIHRNAQVLLNLVNQLLDFRKVEQGMHTVKVSFGNIGSYIQMLTENFNELARKKRIDFTFICKEDITGYYDADIIERIIFNLLSNAFKFTNEEGEVIVSLDFRPEQENLTLEVRDNGIGMSADVKKHLFDRFSHTYVKREHGSGIGLSYTKGLVELYHGTIDFESEEHIGTSFLLKLPYKKEAFVEDVILDEQEGREEPLKDVDWLLESNHNPLKPIGDKSTDREYTLLLVEDNKDILFYLGEQFRDRYNIKTASEGCEALDICLNSHIDLVVSDVMMPGMDGLDFCEALKDDDRINHIPVILLTAKKTSDAKLTGYEKGADAYISKPFDMQELETRIVGLIASRKKLQNKIRTNIDLSPSNVEVTTLDERFLKNVLSYIEKHMDRTDFTVEMLARECGMSQLHLNKKLKVLVGQTANVFIRRMRLKRAAQLLEKNRYSINEVMYEVGFADAKYFRSCFKKEFEMTPSDYQKNHKKETRKMK